MENVALAEKRRKHPPGSSRCRSAYRVGSMWTSCQKHTSQAVQRFSAKDFSIPQCCMRSCCTWSIPKVHLWLAVFLHINRSCPLAFRLFFFRTLNTLPSEKKWLITITSGAGSHRLILLHTHSPPPPPRYPHPSVPRCPPVLSLCFPCSTLQEINVAVRPFIYLECCHRWEGHGKPQLPHRHKYGQAAWTFSTGLDTDSDRLLPIKAANGLYSRGRVFYLSVSSCRILYVMEWIVMIEPYALE